MTTRERLDYPLSIRLEELEPMLEARTPPDANIRGTLKRDLRRYYELLQIVLKPLDASTVVSIWRAWTLHHDVISLYEFLPASTSYAHTRLILTAWQDALEQAEILVQSGAVPPEALRTVGLIAAKD